MPITEKTIREIQKRFEKDDEYELYSKAFEIVASTGDENPKHLAEKLAISEELAESLIQKMRDNGDIGCDGECEDSEETDDGCFHMGGDLFTAPEKIIEGLCFLGDVIQDASEKICEVLDESVERVMDFDF